MTDVPFTLNDILIVLFKAAGGALAANVSTPVPIRKMVEQSMFFNVIAKRAFFSSFDE